MGSSGKFGSRLGVSRPIIPFNTTPLGSAFPISTGSQVINNGPPVNGSIEMKPLENKAHVGNVVASKPSQVAPLPGVEVSVKVETVSTHARWPCYVVCW